MLEPKQLVVPGLGVLILVSILFMALSGYHIGFMVVLGLLGLALIGTLFLPEGVQAEARIVLTVLGLLTLFLMIPAIGFWLALASFAAIGILIIENRRILRSNLHTLEWINSLTAGAAQTAAAPPVQPAAAPQPTAEAQTTAPPPAQPAAAPQPMAEAQAAAAPPAQPADAPQPTAEAQAAVPPPAAAQPAPAPPPPAAPQARASGGAGLSVSVGGIIAAIMGLLVLVSVALPWYSVSFSGFGFGSSESISGWEFVSLAMEENEPQVLLGALLLAGMALVGIVSIILPKFVPMIAGLVGMLLLGYVFVRVTAAVGDIGEAGISAGFSIGFWLAFISFLIMFVVQLIPGTGRPSR